MKNIIFIEGVSGVGKSTTVQKLSERLRSLGYSTICHVEGDSDSPLDLCWVAYLDKSEYENLLVSYPMFSDVLSKNIIYKDEYILLRYQIERTPLYSQELHEKLQKLEFCYNPVNNVVPLSRFTEVFVNLWKQFTKSDAIKCDYAIFDASLVAHMTNDLIRNYNASKVELVNHLEKLLQTIHSLNPIIFYLSSEDVRERLIKARRSRGQTYPDDERIKFWEKRKQMDLAVIPDLFVKSQMIDIINDDWDSVVSEIVSQLTNEHTPL
ncbi:hypothetical protein [Lachnoclostridium sp.]|uniref:hypothetical protein n=1 Tax=Lachnoclostridium sp. TaxID=2028282 RepID=UPI0028A1AEB8|nr:hypothetical protein [Lachnoclostridium sp.]